jgi:folate-binding protein YgfZ
MSDSFQNPLREVHRQAEAEFQDWAEVEIVSTFGEPQAEYAAMHKSAGMMDLPQRGIIEITGKDRLPFLNNLLTNQMWDKATKTGMAKGAVAYGFILNLKGRIAADMNVIELGERTLIEMDVRLVNGMVAVLQEYQFAEAVTIQSRVGELHEIALHGPKAAQLLGAVLEKPMTATAARLFDSDVVAWRDDPTGSPGYYLILPINDARQVWMNLISKYASVPGAGRQMRPAGWAAFNAARIEGGRPLLGIDFDAAPLITAMPGKRDEPPADAPLGALPAETGLFDRAVSVTKGCYLGQEIVARMHARNQVARQVVGIKMDDGALPMSGAQVFDDQSNTVGVVTSSTVSPILSNAAIALATIKKSHFATGTRIKIPAEGAVRGATVVPLPFLGDAKKEEPQMNTDEHG